MHINVELCNSTKSVKYIFSYIIKESDQATLGLEKSGTARPSLTTAEPSAISNKVEERDEVTNYQNHGYIQIYKHLKSFWRRTLQFLIHRREPAVVQL